ncbi:AABR07057237.1 [Phodopus roborovskii]|uniref:Cytochrome b-c1 complex subunit 10 n=1 Tax=Phodopus roborovskii TaxID=109678 RepID=A0AAU9YZS6_PHORO|nr:AABR07057237.1 [Phodopus roborovskii]
MGEGSQKLGQCLTASVPARIPTASMWGAVGAVGVVWATDWRLILDWVPYINGKFKKDD